LDTDWSISMTPERLFDLAAEFAQATGNAERFHARAASAADDDRAALTEKAETWDARAARRREQLRTALREALRGAVRAVPDDNLPVATRRPGQVEVRAVTTDRRRAVRVRYTPAQALAAGAALIACAAITDERGGALAGVLAAFPPSPAPDTAGTDESTGARS
jgi:hypothetical protein